MAKTDMIEIRQCCDKDFDEILVLLRQLWPDKAIKTSALKAVFEKAVASTSRTYFGATDENEHLVGLVTLFIKHSLWQEGLVGYVEELVVEEKVRRRGIGTALLRHIIALARDRGCRCLELDSAYHREAAHRFYERLGFKNRAALFSMAL